MSYKEIGTIRLTKGYVTATDPCYDRNTWCTLNIKNVLAGNWKAFAFISDEGRWGDRVAELRLVHENYADEVEEIQFDDFEPGAAGVDAGLCGFFEDKPDYDDNTWKKLCDNYFFKEKFGIASLDNDFKCAGVWSESGYGDGSYSVLLAHDKSGYVYAMTLIYIDNSDEIEDEMSDDLIDEYDDFEEENEEEN